MAAGVRILAGLQSAALSPRAAPRALFSCYCGRRRISNVPAPRTRRRRDDRVPTVCRSALYLRNIGYDSEGRIHRVYNRALAASTFAAHSERSCRARRARGFRIRTGDDCALGDLCAASRSGRARAREVDRVSGSRSSPRRSRSTTIPTIVRSGVHLLASRSSNLCTRSRSSSLVRLRA